MKMIENVFLQKKTLNSNLRQIIKIKYYLYVLSFFFSFYSVYIMTFISKKICLKKKNLEK